MNLSTTSLSFEKAAERLISDVVQTFKSSGNVSGSPRTSAVAGSLSSKTDLIDFSTTAKTLLSAQNKALISADGSVSATTNSNAAWSSSGQSYDLALGLALQAAQSGGTSTSFTSNFSNGVVTQQVVAGSLASVIQGTNATGSASAQPAETPAVQNFAQLYAAQQAEGISGRFYNGADLDQFTSNMSDAEKAAFTTAYNNHTLTIQSVSDSGVSVDAGQITTTFSESGAGGSEVMSANGAGINYSSLAKTNQYYGATYSPFFGYTIVSWGGTNPSTSATS
jgi:hypothetical protein